MSNPEDNDNNDVEQFPEKRHTYGMSVNLDITIRKQVGKPLKSRPLVRLARLNESLRSLRIEKHDDTRTHFIRKIVGQSGQC